MCHVWNRYRTSTLHKADLGNGHTFVVMVHIRNVYNISHSTGLPVFDTDRRIHKQQRKAERDAGACLIGVLCGAERYVNDGHFRELGSDEAVSDLAVVVVVVEHEKSANAETERCSTAEKHKHSKL